MKNIVAVLVGLFIIAPSLFAEEAPATTSRAAYLEQLQTKLDHVARRANQPVASGSSVAGLRGSKQEPASKQLYWKGKTTETPVTVEEVKMFRTAVEEARAGKTDVATLSLKSFIEKYPKSGLKPDAEETLRVLASLPSVPNQETPKL